MLIKGPCLARCMQVGDAVVLGSSPSYSSRGAVSQSISHFCLRSWSCFGPSRPARTTGWDVDCMWIISISVSTPFKLFFWVGGGGSGVPILPIMRCLGRWRGLLKTEEKKKSLCAPRPLPPPYYYIPGLDHGLDPADRVLTTFVTPCLEPNQELPACQVDRQGR